MKVTVGSLAKCICSTIFATFLASVLLPEFYCEFVGNCVGISGSIYVCMCVGREGGCGG